MELSAVEWGWKPSLNIFHGMNHLPCFCVFTLLTQTFLLVYLISGLIWTECHFILHRASVFSPVHVKSNKNDSIARQCSEYLYDGLKYGPVVYDPFMFLIWRCMCRWFSGIQGCSYWLHPCGLNPSFLVPTRKCIQRSVSDLCVWI